MYASSFTYFLICLIAAALAGRRALLIQRVLHAYESGSADL